MKDFLYQLKGKEDSHMGNWQWPPLWTDIVTAENIKAAKKHIHDEYEKAFPSRVLKKDLDSNEFLLIVKEIKEGDFRTRDLFKVRECQQCGAKFKIIEKYQLQGPGGGEKYCSHGCEREQYQVKKLRNGFNEDAQGIHKPIIYKITNKVNGMCYIGKTTQAFTLRWYQHFFQGAGTKFHEAVRESPVTDWMFEVIEVIQIPDTCKTKPQCHTFILERETYWMKHYDSIDNGYNSLESKLIEAIFDDNQIKLEL
jgi:hypothetical protein